MPAPKKNHSKTPPARELRPNPEPETKTAAAAPHSGEIGWLPEFVYTGEKFEPGLAFFADGLGRITRFSREPADLAAARRLPGQAALPGLVNVHSISWQRVLRGRTEYAPKPGDDPAASWRAGCAAVAARISDQELYETARMAFTEMLLSGITAVGEFHELHHQPDGSPWPEPGHAALQLLRAAHDAGLRISLFNVAAFRAGPGQPIGSAPLRFGASSVDAFLRETEELRTRVAAQYPADEAWLGIAPESAASVPVEALKPMANYAHAQRMRVQMRLGAPAGTAGGNSEAARGAVAVLVDSGMLDKRFTALHATDVSSEDCRALGTARATVCCCPTAERNLALPAAPVDKLVAAGAGLALGTAGQMQIDLLKEARELEYGQRREQQKRPAFAPDVAKALFHAATVTGARSLGATGGALEVGRPADFFTINLYDPSIAGATPDTLLANVIFALERRAIREVWIGARQRIVNGRHPDQGLIVGRFVEMQRRLWGA